MQNITSNPTLAYEAFVAELHLKMVATLDNADYRDGFQTGMEAYESECENQERKLSTQEMLKDIRRTLYPTPKQRLSEATYGIQANPMFDSGFLAGWLHAHMTYVYAPDAPLSEVQLLVAAQSQPAKIIPIRMQ